MTIREKLGLLIVAFLLAPLASCRREEPERISAPGLEKRTGVTEVGPVKEGRVVTGQTVYVPAYSSILTSDRATAFNLAVTLSVRNTDPAHSIVVVSVRYYDQEGKVIREHLKTPLRIAPMASTDFFVAEGDTSGGVSASFLVEWVSEQTAYAPLIESVMIGTASTQGVSFTCPGRILVDRSRQTKGAGTEQAADRPGRP